MITDLIVCYANSVDPIDVEARNRANLPSGLILDYPHIGRDVVSAFYAQLDRLTAVIRDVIVGNFYSSIDGNGVGTWGATPPDLSILESDVLMVIERDFFADDTQWMYTYTSGDFSAITPLIINCITIFITVNARVYANVIEAVKTAYPWTISGGYANPIYND
jgi:hypothetical protein